MRGAGWRIRPSLGVRRVACLLAGSALVVATSGSAGSTAAGKPAAKLPLLVVLPSPDLHVGLSTDAPRMLSGQEVLYGCDPYETVQEQARRCLRFDTLVTNLGQGPLELRYDGKGVAGAMRARQRVFRADGSYVDRAAGSFSFDPAHGHFHYATFALASLWRSDTRSHRLGTKPVAQGHKDGFCLEDLDAYTSSAGPATYTFPAACYPMVQPDGSLTQVNGISPGWLDVYDETLTNQSIEITGVADGYYLLQITVDPLHTLLVDPRSHPTSWQLIRLCGTNADIVGRTTTCGTASPHRSTPTTDRTGQQWREVCPSRWCPVLPQTGWTRLGRLWPAG
jgi:hypothetical protein